MTSFHIIKAQKISNINTPNQDNIAADIIAKISILLIEFSDNFIIINIINADINEPIR